MANALKSWQPLTQNSASILIDTATQVLTCQEYDISFVYIKLQPFCMPFCQSNVQQIFKIYCLMEVNNYGIDYTLRSPYVHTLLVSLTFNYCAGSLRNPVCGISSLYTVVITSWKYTRCSLLPWLYTECTITTVEIWPWQLHGCDWVWLLCVCSVCKDGYVCKDG